MIFDNNNNLINIQINYDNNFLVINNDIIYHYFSGILIFEDTLIPLSRKIKFLNLWGNNQLFFFGLSELDDFDFLDINTSIILNDLLDLFFYGGYHPLAHIIL